MAKISGAHKLPLYIMVEKNPKKIHAHSLDGYMNHYPAGGSYKQLDHYRQILITGQFKMYDYMFQKKMKENQINLNVEHYGQDSPPLYPTQNLRDLPIALITGTGDRLC